MALLKVSSAILLFALSTGCGPITHHLYPGSPVEEWQKANRLTESHKARLTLESGHQLLVNDIELAPDTSSFIGADANTRLLIATDQIRGALVLKRGQNTARYAGSGIVIGGVIGALLGYGSGDTPDESMINIDKESKAAIGAIGGAFLGGIAGFTVGMGRDSFAVHTNDSPDLAAPVAGAASDRPVPGTSLPPAKLPRAASESVRQGLGRETWWRYSTTFGYTVGFGAAVMGGWYWSTDQVGFDAVPIALAGGLYGMYHGVRIGGRADDALFLGTPLSARHRYAVRVGTIMSGASAGLIAASRYINASDANRKGGPTDEEVIRDWTLIGAGLGLLAQLYFDSSLYPDSGERTTLAIVPGCSELALRFTFD